MKTESAEPTTVGEMVSEEFLQLLSMSPYNLADLMGIHYNRIENILTNSEKIDRNEGLILARVFNTDSNFWNSLQENYDNWATKNNHYK